MRKRKKDIRTFPKVVRANRLELVDRHGRRRATLGVFNDLTSLTFYNQKGEMSFTLREEILGWVEMHFFNHGKRVVLLGNPIGGWHLALDQGGIMKSVCLADSK